MRKILTVLSFFTFCFFISCSEENSEVSGLDPNNFKLFELVPQSQHRIEFNNVIQENGQLNYLAHEAMFDGAGVGVGDFNNDGLSDLFFCGNVVRDKLYLNKGNLRFEDISKSSGISANNNWSTGVAIADVNGDGWQDIYVCRFFYVDDAKKRKNILYINNGDLSFTDRTNDYGVGDMGHSIAAGFLDFDLDGDLDLFVGNQPPNDALNKKKFKNSKNFTFTDRLFRNDGQSFTDITAAAGITNFGYTLSVSFGDLNNDGYPDIYVSNDYEEPDNYYQNNQNGTFTDISKEALRHISYFCMGSDIADYNNDGWLDIYTVDMVASDNFRLKTNMSGMNPERFFQLVDAGYHHQYMFNALQQNNGNGMFSDVAQMVGVSNTDWSWSCLLSDFDNDGFKDLYVTNSQPRDIRNNDWLIASKTFMQDKLKEAQEKKIKTMHVSPIEVLDLAPSIKLENHVYRSSPDFMYSRINTTWGLGQEAWSYGAAYVDLDNDGDQDLVVNNINDNAFVYKNRASDERLSNYLRINPVDKNGQVVIGARAEIFVNGNRQLSELFTSRGYMSACEQTLHFGLGAAQKVDSIIVYFPSGKTFRKNNLKVNKELLVKESEAKTDRFYNKKSIRTLFSETNKDQEQIKHEENTYDDYQRETLLPYKMSSLGPVLAKADINGDGIEDMYLGGSSGIAGQLIIQTKDKQFQIKTNTDFVSDKLSEDQGALFFDANGDSFPDLFVSSGSNEFQINSSELRDRLYLNDGKGNFKKANSLPDLRYSSGEATSVDFDEDGDMDLFVCGRQVPGKYGLNAKSVLLRNNKGKFEDVSNQLFENGLELGMVTSAIFTDIDNDKDKDLIIAGEWMPISIFINQDGNFSNQTSSYGLSNTNGWWNVVKALDVDGDGDQDLVAGNLGLNIKYKASEKEPFKVYVSDFDENGTHDVYLGYHENGVCYPVRGRQCSSQQMPFIKKEFPNYAEFAKASIEEVLKDRVQNSILKEAKMFESGVFINNGSNFEFKAFPKGAQVSPIYSIVTSDFNKDGITDLATFGNYYNREVETTRSDAGIGSLMFGRKDGAFDLVHPSQSGLTAFKDVRDAVLLNENSGQAMIVLANNNDHLQIFSWNEG